MFSKFNAFNHRNCVRSGGSLHHRVCTETNPVIHTLLVESYTKLVPVDAFSFIRYFFCPNINFAFRQLEHKLVVNFKSHYSTMKTHSGRLRTVRLSRHIEQCENDIFVLWWHYEAACAFRTPNADTDLKRITACGVVWYARAIGWRTLLVIASGCQTTAQSTVKTGSVDSFVAVCLC